MREHNLIECFDRIKLQSTFKGALKNVQVIAINLNEHYTNQNYVR